jgi:hypothetical protein
MNKYFLSFGFIFFVVVVAVVGISSSNMISSNIISSDMKMLFKDDYYYSMVSKLLVFDYMPEVNAQEQNQEKEGGKGEGKDVADYNNENNDNKYVILMFDRGYETTFTTAKPILDKYGFKASIFIACGNIEGGKGMNWNQIRELYEDEHDIQSHGSEHTKLVDLKSHEEVVSIVKEGKQCIEEKGFNPQVFQAPYNKGGDDPQIVNTIAEYFDFAFTGHSELMFLNCDGYENFGYDDKKSYKGSTDCRPFFSDGTPTPTNRYAIKEWSHDREHDKIYESKYLGQDPHGKKVNEAVLEKFIEVVNSQTKFNKNGEINAIPIIGYHKIDTGKDYYTSPELFEQEMEYLYENGFQVITLDDLGYDENQQRFYIKNVDTPRVKLSQFQTKNIE